MYGIRLFHFLQKEKRASCFDLQTFTVHFPANRYKKVNLGKPGNYPIALIPGQNTDYYKKYTPNELKYFPLNTVLYGPVRPNERHFGLPGGSDGSQSEIEDSSSSDDSSSSSSEETQDTEGTSSTAEDDGHTESKPEKPEKVEKTKEVEEKEPPKPIKIPPKNPRGRGRGRISAANAAASAATSTQSGLQANPPEKKRLGRPPKLKVAAVKLKKIDSEDLLADVKEEKPDPALRVIIRTCKMCHEEETKNKNGVFEAFIECAQCKGKIHPSCIDLTADMIPKISSYRWQCTDCKSCVKCEQSSHEDKMIFCDHCDRGYHIYCVGLSEVPSGNYICPECKEPEAANESVENGSETLERPTSPENIEVKEEIPEIKTEIKTEQEKPIKESEVSEVSV